jgi:hypothetical protein
MGSRFDTAMTREASIPAASEAGQSELRARTDTEQMIPADRPIETGTPGIA